MEAVETGGTRGSQTIMKKILALSTVFAIGAMMLAGCPKAQEAANAGADAASGAMGAAKDAGAGAMEAGKDKMAGAMGDAKDKMAAALDPAKIKEAITGPDYANVKAEVKDGKVVLTGKVKNNDLKKSLTSMVEKVAMGAKVQNMVLVGE
jgi:osmotically-inducible protein OsmY